MNLANRGWIIFALTCVFFLPLRAQQMPASPSSTATPPTNPTASQNTPSNSQGHKRKRKKSVVTNCGDVGTNESVGADAQKKAPTNSTKSAGTTTPCPPPKKVVTNGSTTEPAVQLTGGEGNAQAQDRSTTDQLLGSTEENLKKISAKELTADQQDMVGQIRDYMQQSRAAVTSGDTERGRMLAQKARLLSDELAKP